MIQIYVRIYFIYRKKNIGPVPRNICLLTAKQKRKIVKWPKHYAVIFGCYLTYSEAFATKYDN